MTSRTYLATTIPTSNLQDLYSMIQHLLYWHCRGSWALFWLLVKSFNAKSTAPRSFWRFFYWGFEAIPEKSGVNIQGWILIQVLFNIYNSKKGMLLTCGILDRNRHKIEVDRRFQMFHRLCNICTQYIAMDISLQKWSYFQ